MKFLRFRVRVWKASFLKRFVAEQRSRSEESLEEITAIFQELDTDNDGKLSRKELDRVIERSLSVAQAS